MAKVSADITESYVSEVRELLESSRKDIMTLKSTQNDPDTLSRLHEPMMRQYCRLTDALEVWLGSGKQVPE